MNFGKTLERPIGKKAENKKLKKRKISNDVVLRLSSKLDEIKEQKRRMHDEKKESMRIELEERRELICIKEEKNEIEKTKVKDEIMMKDIGNMDLEQNE